MNDNKKIFELSKNIEHYLAVLSKLYGQEGKKREQELIVNAQIRVNEEWSYDNWDGGIYGHALYLIIPESLYFKMAKQKEKIRRQIKEDINKVHSIQNEYIAEVIIEMEVPEDQNWRRESGLLLSGKRVAPQEAENRIWEDQCYRVFLCHVSEAKKQAASLKEELLNFGASGFVAHKDIHPTKEWQIEIENALSSMDALVALMTDGFRDSLWTDQEVGFAFGREVPIISVRLGKDPYGFIGKFQALSCPLEETAKDIVKIFINNDRMINAYINAVQNCRSFDQGNLLSEILPGIDKLSDRQANDLVAAFNDNGQVRSSFGFNGEKPRLFGRGLVFHLIRLTGKKYRYSSSGKIEIKK